MTTSPERPRGTGAVWLIARLIVSVFYRVQRIGSALPEGPVLLVANHPNSVLDPALVQTTAGRRVRFLAKSTLFKGHLLSPLIRRSGAIPVYRRVDPGVDVSRNVEMFAAVEAVLAQGDVVCLFPEGISHAKGKLEPLRTGAARMALSSLAKGVHVTIVPLGLNFDRLAAFRSRATVAFGGPFGCEDLAALYAEDAQAAVRTLTERIGEHLRRLMVEADPHRDLRLVDRIDRLYAAARGVSRAPERRLQRRRIIAAGIDRLRAKDPEQFRSILDNVNDYDARLTRLGLRDRDVEDRVSASTAVQFTVRELLLALMLGPLATVGVLLFAMPYGITSVVARQPEDLQLRATWKTVGGTMVYGVWILLLGVITGVLYGLAVGVAVFIALPITAVGALLAFEREAAVIRTVRAALALRQTPLVARARLKRQRAQIASVLESVQEWLGEDGR